MRTITLCVGPKKKCRGGLLPRFCVDAIPYCVLIRCIRPSIHVNVLNIMCRSNSEAIMTIHLCERAKCVSANKINQLELESNNNRPQSHLYPCEFSLDFYLINMY